MNRKDTIEQIKNLEDNLFENSRNIKFAESFDSIISWLKNILEDEENISISKLFNIPTESSIRKAILTLISTN
jgi:hypothetical protein